MIEIGGKVNHNISNESNIIDKQEISFNSGEKNKRVKPKFFLNTSTDHK